MDILFQIMFLYQKKKDLPKEKNISQKYFINYIFNYFVQDIFKNCNELTFIYLYVVNIKIILPKIELKNKYLKRKLI